MVTGCVNHAKCLASDCKNPEWLAVVFNGYWWSSVAKMNELLDTGFHHAVDFIYLEFLKSKRSSVLLGLPSKWGASSAFPPHVLHTILPKVFAHLPSHTHELECGNLRYIIWSVKLEVLRKPKHLDFEWINKEFYFINHTVLLQWKILYYSGG